ncbi:MAG TPA: dihydroorotate dehydrogenase electron transfer subunit, partial [Bacillota bacterium]|nr:dihydroorotate dehydrogenase electron transfer subunit [Bacillota bacterium]
MGLYEVISNTPLTHNVFELKLRGDTSRFTRPGQFAQFRLDGFFLRRPISLHDMCGDMVSFIFRASGAGTDVLSLVRSGTLDVLTGLGNGYDTVKSTDSPAVIGGGIGIPPLYYLVKTLVAEGKKPRVILGFNTKDDVFAVERFKALCDDVHVVTADGSVG